MAGAKFVVHVTGNPNIPTLRLINARARPGTSMAIAVLFQVEVGTRNLPVLDVQPDADGNALNNRVYQWFQVRFPNGIEAWLRDDLVSVQGDGSRFGYPNLSNVTYALTLTRVPVPAPSPQPPTPNTPPVLTPPGQPTPPQPPILQPEQPAPSPAPAPPTPAPEPAPPPVVPGVVTGVAIGSGGLNMRRAPISGVVFRRLAFGEQVRILNTTPQPSSNFIWAEVETGDGVRGWVRSDFLSITGDGSALGLSAGDEYPAPMRSRVWVRGHNDGHNANEAPHLGWDFGCAHGEPVLAGPRGGKVTQLLTCTRCSADRPNVLSNNVPLNSPAVFGDPAWGFGYGNAVVVRYHHDLLPVSTRTRLRARGLDGAHVYVLYAHLSGVDVKAGDDLAANARIGAAGNTGNSTATHLHLEVRASKRADESSWFNMRANVFDPALLFLR